LIDKSWFSETCWKIFHEGDPSCFFLLVGAVAFIQVNVVRRKDLDHVMVLIFVHNVSRVVQQQIVQWMLNVGAGVLWCQ
jgi:hypothetical protein